MADKKFIVADQSVDYRIIESGISVHSILNESPGISDSQVLSIANNRNALLVTEDKDFGEFVIRFKQPHCGILLIRITGNLTKNHI